MLYCILLSLPLALLAGLISPWIAISYLVAVAAYTLWFILRTVKTWGQVGNFVRICACVKLFVFAVTVVNLVIWDMLAVWL